MGEGPGGNEDQSGIPFVGRSGQRLNRALKRAFFTEHVRSEVPVTNVVKCRPPGNRKPFDSEIKTCKSLYLVQEILEIDPIAILALGNSALEALTGYSGITTVRGQWMTEELTGQRVPVLPTYHPSYVERNIKEHWALFLSDVEAFAHKVIVLQ